MHHTLETNDIQMNFEKSHSVKDVIRKLICRSNSKVGRFYAVLLKKLSLFTKNINNIIG